MEQNFQGPQDRNINNQSFKMPNPRIPRVYQVCALFSVVTILLINIGSLVQKREIYSGLLITELLLVALPSLALLYIFRFDFKKVLRLNKIPAVTGIVTVIIMPFAMMLSGVINFFFLLLVKQIFGKINVPPVPTATDFSSLVISLLIIAGSAGVCEELLFRGIIMRGFERYGKAAAIMISAFLFGLMHLDFQKLVGIFLLGSLIGYFVYRSNSIYAGMLAHFTNNAAGVFISFIGYQLRKYQNVIGAEGLPVQETVTDIMNPFTAIPAEMRTSAAIGLIIFIIFLVGLFAGLILLFNYLTRESADKQGLYLKDGDKIYPGILWLLPGILVVFFMYLSTAALLMGTSPAWLKIISRFIFPWRG